MLRKTLGLTEFLFTDVAVGSSYEELVCVSFSGKGLSSTLHYLRISPNGDESPLRPARFRVERCTLVQVFLAF